MEFKNICTRKSYTKDNQEIVKWLQAGTLRINNDGKMFIEMNHAPDTTFYVFDQKEKTSEGSL